MIFAFDVLIIFCQDGDSHYLKRNPPAPPLGIVAGMSRDEESHGQQSDSNRIHACNDSQGGCGGDPVSKNVNHHLDKSDQNGESKNHQI